MVVQFAKWGNSVALRVPKRLLREIGVTEGQSADISVQNGRLVVTPLDEVPSYDLSAHLAEIGDENLRGAADTGAAAGNDFE
jgi:antitoxin component of MazEF toxin-antitoxin module